MICDKCGKELEPKEVKLNYLGYSFVEKLPSCPVCGMVYVSEDLAKGKFFQLETQFEEK